MAPPIKLNLRHLETNSKGYAEFLPLGDVHLGSSGCFVDKVQANIQYCLAKHVYVATMGDLLEMGTKGSVGAGVYEQIMQPQEQIDAMIEMLRPLADAGLLLGMLDGNHEIRPHNTTGIQVTKLMSAALSGKHPVPYLGYSRWNYWYVGGTGYKIYLTHGEGASKKKHTKLKKVLDIAQGVASRADLVCMGHVHDILFEAVRYPDIDPKTKKKVYIKQYACTTGGYHDDEGYVAMKNYEPGLVGSPKIKLFSGKKDIHISM